MTGYIGKLVYKTGNGLVVLCPPIAPEKLYGLEDLIAQMATPVVNTAAWFLQEDPVLENGRCGYESDTGYLKIGDGTTSYSNLAYVAAPSGS